MPPGWGNENCSLTSFRLRDGRGWLCWRHVGHSPSWLADDLSISGVRDRAGKVKKVVGISGLGVVFAAVVWRSRVSSLFSANYLPHRFCYLAQPGLIWTNTLSDSLIALAYGLLVVCLLWIAVRLRRVPPFQEYLWIFSSFAVFIAACAATHLMEVVTVWWPVYPLSAAVKVLCAGAAILTAILFGRATPALAAKIPWVMNALSTTQQERDEARAALLASEKILAERMRADVEIAAANARMNHILDSSREAILKIGTDWIVSYGNLRATEILPDLVVGSDFWGCFPALAGTQAERCIRRTMDEHTPTNYEIFYEPYGEWYGVSVFPTPGGVSLFCSPITAQKKLEEQLQRERAEAFEQINSVMDSTAEGIVKLGHDWSILYGNRVAREILPDLVVGKSYWECFPAVKGTASEHMLRQVMEKRKDAEWENFYEPYHEWYAVHTYPTAGGVSLFFIPITRRKNLEAQLETERMLREKRIEALSIMAGGLAHEISNPLAIIHGTASDLQRMALSGLPMSPDEVLKASESIVNTSDRAHRILRGLKGFGREAGKDPMEYASVYEIIDQAIEMQEARFERHQVALRTELAPELPLVLCRETQIGQIVTNLVNNSLDAITQQDCPERWVSVEASRSGDNVQIDVVDSGLGIDEESRKRLMEPFFTTKTRGLGMGVGLSLSRAIANEHGGSLELCQGMTHTCFRLLLPINSSEPGSLMATGVVHETH